MIDFNVGREAGDVGLDELWRGRVLIHSYTKHRSMGPISRRVVRVCWCQIEPNEGRRLERSLAGDSTACAAKNDRQSKRFDFLFKCMNLLR